MKNFTVVRGWDAPFGEVVVLHGRAVDADDAEAKSFEAGVRYFATNDDVPFALHTVMLGTIAADVSGLLTSGGCTVIDWDAQ